MKKKLIARNSELVILIFILILCLSCKAQKKGGAEVNDVAKDTVLTLVVCDDYGGSEIQEFQVIKDKKSLQKTFAKINMTRKPGLPVPTLDFSKEIAIFASRGQANGSSQIQLEFSSETSEQLIFEFDVFPVPNNTAITTPFCLYKIPFTQKELVFREAAE